MTAVDRHRQAAARLLTAIPHADDRVTLVAAALAETEAAALRDAADAIAADQHVDLDYVPDVLRDRADDLDGGSERG